MKSFFFAALLATGISNGSTVLADDDAFFLMSGSQLECLAINVNKYLETQENTLFIKPSACDTELTGTTLSFEEITQNAAPKIRIIEDTNKPDAVVVLTKDDLACIAAQTFPTKANLVAFYPRGCRIEVRTP